MHSIVRLSLRNLLNNRLRFALTTFAILLGVSFVVASFVLTDGLLKTFEDIVEEANVDVDAQVRAQSEFEEVAFTDRPIDEDLLDVVAEVEGVEEALPGSQSAKIVPVKADGVAVQTLGAPILSFNWFDSTLSPLSLVAGASPDEPGEFALDESTAANNDFELGQTYDVIGIAGSEPFTLVGLTRFGDENSLGGSVLMSFTMAELQRLDGTVGLITFINIAGESGQDGEVLIDRLNAALPEGVEAVAGTVVIEETQEDFEDIIGVFGNVLLAFALVTVFVSTFIISNTFNIVLGQRVRQLALLRALGATPLQVRFGAMFEALVIGLIAAVVGLGGGVVLALGLRALIGALGFSLPNIELVIAPRTVIVALLVGVGVTLAASISPARRAAAVPPIAAMRAGFRFGGDEGTRRTMIAIVLAVVGMATLAYGVLGDGSTALTLIGLAAGAVLVFVAVAMLAPLFSSPTAAFLGTPLKYLPRRQVTGAMARENAARSNRRTASTAAGLMIGLALISMVTVVADSLKDSFRAELGSTLIADYLITEQANADFSNQLADEVAALPEFAEVSAVRYGVFRIDGDEKDIAATDLTVLTELLDVEIKAGDPASSASPDSIVLSEEVAENNGVGLGDTLSVEFAATGEQNLTVGAIYGNEFLIGHYIIDLSGWGQNFDSQNDNVIAAKVAPGVGIEEAGAALAPAEEAFPQLEFETRDEFRDRLEGQLDSLLIVINVFLGMAIVIALLGITNTMALSVLERTQEIGLMRAVGMTRRQTRSMIRLEGAVVSLFGALLGVLLGMLFGWLAVLAIPDSVISQLSIPAVTLLVYVMVATIAGLLAASFPARRAARLNVLDAIAHS